MSTCGKFKGRFGQEAEGLNCYVEPREEDEESAGWHSEKNSLLRLSFYLGPERTERCR